MESHLKPLKHSRTKSGRDKQDLTLCSRDQILEALVFVFGSFTSEVAQIKISPMSYENQLFSIHFFH